MNIFVLDHNPFVAARYHIDKHVVKMILELAQILSTAHRFLDGSEYFEENNNRRIKRWRLANKAADSMLYKATHVNHPCSIWARDSSENYRWTFDLLRALCAEYTHRYGKVHKTTELLPFLIREPAKIKHRDLSDFAQAIPTHLRQNDAVQAYRDYYTEVKAKTLPMTWTGREIPKWFIKNS